MSQFQKNLESLPSVTDIEQLELFDGNNIQPVWIIENKPGKSGSVAVYNFIRLEYGQLTAESAKIALDIFAEHVASAREKPGIHPNIDLLFDVLQNNRVLSIDIQIFNQEQGKCNP